MAGFLASEPVKSRRADVSWPYGTTAKSEIRAYMSGIERGVRNVSVLTVAKIAKALKVSLTTLFDRL